VLDVVRGFAWPAGFTARVVNNGFVRDWHGREAELSDATVRQAENDRYYAAMNSGDAENTGVWIGEAAGLMHDVRPAGHIVAQIAQDAERHLRRFAHI
jgi:nitronate monooxygenase